MNLRECSQFHLYLLTLHLMKIKEQLIPQNSNERWAYGTIINRAYYSSYLYCELWLKHVKQFKTKHPWEYKKGEKRLGEHKQIRNALYDFGKENMKSELNNLAKLRNKADYHPNKKLTLTDVNEAINHMENIYSHLKFE